MTFEEFVVAIVAIVCGTALTGYLFGKFFGLIKSWIESRRQSYDEEAFNRLAKAFTQYKRDTERRLRNLETIATEEDPSSPAALKQTYKTIEIEDNEDATKSDTANTGLKNMLRE